MDTLAGFRNDPATLADVIAGRLIYNYGFGHDRAVAMAHKAIVTLGAAKADEQNAMLFAGSV